MDEVESCSSYASDVEDVSAPQLSNAQLTISGNSVNQKAPP